jgi:hypothetical protein
MGKKLSFDAKSPKPKKFPSKFHHPYPKLRCVPKRFEFFPFRKEKEEAKDFAPPI